jgi:hypothetical protein
LLGDHRADIGHDGEAGDVYVERRAIFGPDAVSVLRPALPFEQRRSLVGVELQGWIFLEEIRDRLDEGLQARIGR